MNKRGCSEHVVLRTKLLGQAQANRLLNQCEVQPKGSLAWRIRDTQTWSTLESSLSLPPKGGQGLASPGLMEFQS